MGNQLNTNIRRRKFLVNLGIVTTAGSLSNFLSCSNKMDNLTGGETKNDSNEISWNKVRNSFDLDPGIGMNPAMVVNRLQKKNIIANESQYTPSHARLTPSNYNTAEEIEKTLKVIGDW